MDPAIPRPCCGFAAAPKGGPAGHGPHRHPHPLLLPLVTARLLPCGLHAGSKVREQLGLVRS